MDQDKEKWMKEVAKDSGVKISQSKVFLSVFSKDVLEDPRCALEIGIAVMLDKPIALVVVDGVKVPENLKKIAVAIETVKKEDKESMKIACDSIMNTFKDLKEDG